MIRKLFVFGVVFSFICACASTQTAINNFSIPKYNDYITPISVPIQPEYAPVSTDFKISTAIHTSFTENSITKNESEFSEVTGTAKILKLGELLTWDINIKKIITNGKTISTNQPLLAARQLTNKYGKINELELSSPALLAAKKKKKEIDDFIEAMKSSIESNGSELSQNPVRSGDSITKIDKAILTDIFKKIPGIQSIHSDINNCEHRWIVICSIHEKSPNIRCGNRHTYSPR